LEKELMFFTSKYVIPKGIALCGTCNREVDAVEPYDDPVLLRYQFKVKCHGEELTFTLPHGAIRNGQVTLKPTYFFPPAQEIEFSPKNAPNFGDKNK
jgi:hypothetical protein